MPGRSIINHALIVIILLFSLLIVSCATIEELAPPVDEVAVSMALSSGVDPDFAAFGRTIYITSCARCHSPEPVVRYDLSYWQNDILPDMAERSKINEEDTQALEAYIKLVLQVQSSHQLSARRNR